jgi:OFA family oxalate/formate antiporter-like MFS transporter
MTISEATLDAGFAGQVARSNGYRWTQLAMGIVCMAMIANLQYGWTLFVNPIADRHGWSRAAIQVAFTIFVLTETGWCRSKATWSTSSARVPW